MIDAFGLPVTESGDGGDSCATAANMIVCGIGDKIPMGSYLKAEPLRHPDDTKWYGRPGRFSRDQLVALLCALVVKGDELSYIRSKLYTMHAERYLLSAWNKYRNHVYESYQEHLAKSTPDVAWDMSVKSPDLTGPEVWGLWIRAFRVYWLWPLLLVLDLETLIGAVHWRYFRKDNVSRNHLLVCMVTTKIMPTPISFLAKIITPMNNLLNRWAAHCAATGEINAFKGV
jgi:hypothetical protein